MVDFKSDFMRQLASRGYIQQCSDELALDGVASNGTITAYIGYDCTAPSLHVGNLLSIMMLRKLQQTGHKPIVLLGGGTTRVGDPSGKDETRKLLDANTINSNIFGIKKVFSKFITFGDGPTDAILVNNSDWLDKLEYISFLRDFGRHFSVNKMLSFDSVKLRLEREQNLSFLEFNYMILQAYDFLELNRRYGCILQMGGSDQWGNIVNGIDLTRRIDGKQVFGITTALLTTASGAKMGKSVNGAVWLNEEMLSPYDYWQFWRNTEDKDVARFMRLYTDLPLDEISKYAQLQGQEINEAKKVLANMATIMVHGVEAAQQAELTAEKTFEQGGTGSALPTFEISDAKLAAGVGLLSSLVMAGLVESNSEARRFIKSGGAKVNDQKIDDEKMVLNSANINNDGVIKLSIGKKRHALLRPV